jgi:pimeloyl-ACP methyl ester carboxylesterase
MDITADTSIRTFLVDIPQASLDDLRNRLRLTRYQPPLPGDDWDTGIPSAYLRELVDAWHDFDWGRYQARLNEVPQYTTVIDGQVIHFAHVTSAEPGAVPLLVTHGWPGSFLEFLHLIGPMTDPARYGGDPGDAVHLVIPSLPGFGFSTPLGSAGLTTARIAATWAELMTRLGYDRFAVHGGDIGAAVSPEVGRVAPERVIGVHVNGALGFAANVDDGALAAMTPVERDRVARVGAFMRDEYGYIAIQSTRPGLIGIALADSPAAQLAWMLDKLKAWTYPPEALPDSVLGREWILANASLYWFTASGGSAAYVGYAQAGGWGAPPVSSGVPTAAIQFAHDVGIRSSAADANAIARWTDVNDRGGHFAALEEPELLADDIRQFLRGVRDRGPVT